MISIDMKFRRSRYKFTHVKLILIQQNHIIFAYFTRSGKSQKKIGKKFFLKKCFRNF